MLRLTLAAGAVLTTSLAQADSSAVDVTTWNPRGLAFTLGGGVGGFTDSSLSDRADGIGGGYEVRGVFGTSSRLAVEMAHFGLVQRFALEVVDDVRLLAAGGELDLRVNLRAGHWLQPYVVAGAGWTHANLLGQQGQRAGDDDRKNFFHVPAGAGLAMYFGDFVVDIRGQVRLTPEREARLFDDIDGARLSSWVATAQIGWHVP